MFFIHKVKGSEDSQNPGCAYRGIKVTAGSVQANTSAGYSQISVAYEDSNGMVTGTTNIYVVIPNATSISVNISLDGNDVIYVFKQ